MKIRWTIYEPELSKVTGTPHDNKTEESWEADFYEWYKSENNEPLYIDLRKRISQIRNEAVEECISLIRNERIASCPPMYRDYKEWINGILKDMEQRLQALLNNVKED